MQRDQQPPHMEDFENFHQETIGGASTKAHQRHLTPNPFNDRRRHYQILTEDFNKLPFFCTSRRGSYCLSLCFHQSLTAHS